jgi:hypothetical protein
MQTVPYLRYKVEMGVDVGIATNYKAGQMKKCPVLKVKCHHGGYKDE